MGFASILNTNQHRKEIPAPPAPPVTSAINGLHMDGTVVKLGGDLVENTFIEPLAFSLNIARNAEPAVAGFKFAYGNQGQDTRALFRSSGKMSIAVQGAAGNPAYIGHEPATNSIVLSTAAGTEMGRVIGAGGFSAPVNTGYGFAGANGQSAPGMSSNGTNLQLRSKGNNSVALMHDNVIMASVVPQGFPAIGCDGVFATGVVNYTDSIVNLNSNDYFIHQGVVAEPAPVLATEYWELTINGSVKKIAILQ